MNAITDTAFSIGGQYVASSDADGLVKVWDIRSVSQLFTADIGDTSVTTCCFDKTGKYLAIGCSNGEVKMLNVQQNGEVVASFKAHDKASVTQILINQDNTGMFTAGSDGLVKSWQ